MADKRKKFGGLESFSEIERDDVFSEVFIEDLIPDLLDNAAFNNMRQALESSEAIWGTPASSGQKPLHEAVTSLYDSIRKLKSRPEAVSSEDRTAVLKGYLNVFRVFSKDLSARTADANKEKAVVKNETARISNELRKAEEASADVERKMRLWNKSLKEMEEEKRRAEKKVLEEGKRIRAREQKITAMKPLPNSIEMTPREDPNKMGGLRFALPYKSPNTDKVYRAGKISQQAKAAAAEMKKWGRFPTPNEVKRSKKNVVPFQTNAAEHAKNIEYDFQGKYAKEFQKAFGTEFQSASGAGTVPRNRYIGSKGSSAASAYGTAMHALFEKADRQRMRIQDFENLKILNELKKEEPLIAPAFTARGVLLPQARAALQARIDLLRKGTEETVFNERGVGAFLKVGSEWQNRTATIDRLYRDKKTGELILEDYKNEKYLHPFKHLMQLQQEAALLNANAGLIKDDNGKIIDFKNPIRRARISKYNPQTGAQDFTFYELGTDEEFIQTLQLIKDFDQGKIDEKQFFSKLPPVFQRAYADDFGRVRRKAISDSEKTGANWLEILMPNGKSRTSLAFDSKGLPTKTNSLFQLWQKDPGAAQDAITKAFTDPLTPDEYKRQLYWKLYSLGRTVYAPQNAENAKNVHDFADSLMYSVKDTILHPEKYDTKEKIEFSNLVSSVDQKIKKEKEEGAAKRNLDEQLKKIDQLNKKYGIAPKAESEAVRENRKQYSSTEKRLRDLRSSLLGENKEAFQLSKDEYVASWREKLNEATKNRETLSKERFAIENEFGSDSTEALRARRKVWDAEDAENNALLDLEGAERSAAENWLRTNFPEYNELRERLSVLRDQGKRLEEEEKKAQEANLTEEERKNLEKYFVEKEEIEQNIERIYKSYDWFTPDNNNSRSRDDLKKSGVFESGPDGQTSNGWRETAGLRNALYTAAHYHPEYLGNQIKGLAELINLGDEAYKGDEKTRDEYIKKYKEAVTTLLGGMTDDDLRLLKSYLGNGDDYSSAQAAYAQASYDNQASGLYTDDEEFENAVMSAFDSNQAENVFGRYLRLRDKILHGYIGNEVSSEERINAVKSLDAYLMPQNKDAIDLIGTLTGGMARLRYGHDIYDEVATKIPLTEEQKRESSFGAKIAEAMSEAGKRGLTFSEFFQEFGDSLIKEFGNGVDSSGRLQLNANAIQSQYGEAALGWTQRYLRYLNQNPRASDEEIEQRGAEAFRLSNKTGNPVALDRFGYENVGKNVEYPGLTGRYLISKGIPLSALHYERAQNFLDVSPEDLEKVIGLSDEEAEAHNVYTENFGQWKLYDSDYADLYKKAAEEFMKPKSAAQGIVKTALKDSVENAVEETEEAIDRGVPSGAISDLSGSMARDDAPKIIEQAVEQVSEDKKKGKGGSSKKGKAPSSRKKGQESGNSITTSGPVQVGGGNITVKGSPVNIEGSPVTVSSKETQINGAELDIKEIPNGIVYNNGSGAITQNIYTTGSVVLQGGGHGGSGNIDKIGGADWSDLPGAQRYQYLKSKKFEAEGKILKEEQTIERLSLYGKLHSSEIEARQNNIGTLKEEIKKIEADLAEFDALKDSVSAGYKKDIDERFSAKEVERAGQAGIARGRLADERDKIVSKQHDKDYSDLESLYGVQSNILNKIMNDEYRYNTSTSGREKQALADLNKNRLQELNLIQQKIEKAKESTSLTEDEISAIERQAGVTDELNMLAVKAKNKGIGNLWDSLATSFNNIFIRFTQMGMAYSILNKLKKAFAEVTQSATQLDKAMVDLRVVTGASYEEAKSMVHGYAQLGNELAATTLEVSTAAQEWLRQGYDVAEVNRLVESSIKLSVLGMMSASDATKALTSAMKGFKMEAGDVSEIVDKFTSLDMKAATTAGDIATALSKFAATAQMAGVDIDQAAAMATTIMDVSQNDAGATGNALKTIFSRFGNVKAGAYQKMGSGDSDDTTEKLNDIERVLSTLGIQIRSSAREMRDFDDVLDDVAERWQFLDKVSQNAIATALAGTRQRESFAVLMNNYDKYKEFIEVSRNSTGTADQKYESYLEQLEASQKRLKAAWEDIANSTEIASFMTNMNNALSNIVQWLPMIIKYVTKLFITLNSYKMPKLLKNFFGVEGGWKDKGKSLLHGLTSPGFQENVAKYNAKESGGLIDGPARRVAKAFNMVAEAAEKAAGVNTKGTVAATSLADAENAAATASYSGAVAFKASAESSYQVVQANTAEANASMVAANADMAKAGAAVTFDNANMMSYGGLATPEYGGSYNYTAAMGNKVNPFSTNAKHKKHFWNNFKPSKAGAGMAAVGGLSSVAMGLTMGSSGNDVFFGTGRGTFEASKEANAVATANSALSNIGYAWGPIAGMITTTLADLLNRLLIVPLIDREANERKARVEQANKLYEQITGLADNVQALTGYAKEASLSEKDTKEMTDAVYQLLSEYYGMDKDARSGVENSLIPLLRSMGFESVDSIYDAMQEYLKGDADIKKKIALALDYAEKDAALEQERNKNEEKNYQTTKQINELTRASYSGTTGTYEYKLLGSKAAEEGYLITDHFNDIATSYIDVSKMSYDLHEYIEMIDEVLESLDETEAEEIAKYQDLKKQIEDYSAVRRQEMDAYNKQAAQNALLITKISESPDAGYLLDQNADQLKNMGVDKIMRLIADQMVKDGRFSGKEIYIGGDSSNGLSDYARDLIMQAAQADPVLAAALSGNAYSIRDLTKNNGLYNWDSRQEEYKNLVSSFASALHMTQDEFIARLESGELTEKIGNMTLGDFLKTPEELRQSMEDLSSLFQSLANNAFLTAENLEKVINNYPQFIQYLGDTSSLMDAMVHGLAEYAQVYTTKIYDQLISSTDYAESLKTKLYASGEYDTEALRSAIGGATSVKDIIEKLKDGPDALGLSTSDYNKLVDTFTHLFDKIDVGQIFMRQIAVDTVIPYADMRLDRQLNALNKQKEALQQINKQREYENKLIEARNKLEEAGKEKQRVWREGVGWVYEANQDAIAEAQKNLQEVENERQIRELDIMIDQVNAEKELLKAIQDDAKFKALEEAMSSLLGEDASKTGINGLINITKKLYEGDYSVMDSLGDTGKTLAELKNQLATLLEKQFGIDYSGDYSAAELLKYAQSGTSAQRRAAREELKKRGYNYVGGDYNSDGSQNLYGSYTLPTLARESDIQAAIEAYGLGVGNKDEIAAWLSEHGYEYKNGKWKKATQTYRIKDQNGKGITGSWAETEDPLSLSSPYYKWIESDFRNGKAAYYKLEGGEYVHQGDITDHKTSYFDDLSRWMQEHEGYIINGWDKDAEVAIVRGGQLYGLYRAALGSLGLPGGPTLINEHGTEAIVTPYGTLTSLPSGTGVVPADVTKNLWALGEVAPAISRLLDPMVKKGEAVIGDSFNVQNMVINMNPDGSFDVDSFVNELKSAVALRKNS